MSSSSRSSTKSAQVPLQERKRARNHHTQKQLNILLQVQTDIMQCNSSLCLPIWRPLLDQARSTIAVCRQHVNQVTLDEISVTNLKQDVVGLLDTLECRWRDLSSLLPDEPRDYPTGKYNCPFIYIHYSLINVI